MKLLKITSLAALALLISHTATAQLYINVGVGYNAPAIQQLMMVDYNQGQSSTTYKGIYNSLGQGFMPAIAIGHKINPNVGIEIGYGMLIGSKITADINDASSANVETGTQVMSANIHRLMLGARIDRNEGNVHPYIRIGIVVGVGTRVINEVETTTTGPAFSSSYHSIEEYDGGMSVGFSTGFGLTYHVSESFGIFVEAGLIAQNYAPTHSEITTLDVDGQDQLGSMTIRQKETNYVDEYTTTNPPNDGEPDEDLSFYFPASSMGISIGIHLWFPAK